MRQTWNKSLYNTYSYTLYLNTVCLMHVLKCCSALMGKHTRTHARTQAHKASGTRRGCNLTPRSMQQKILNAFHALRLTLSLSQLLLSLSLPQSLLQSALLLCFPSLSISLTLSPSIPTLNVLLRVCVCRQVMWLRLSPLVLTWAWHWLLPHLPTCWQI